MLHTLRPLAVAVFHVAGLPLDTTFIVTSFFAERVGVRVGRKAAAAFN